MDSPVEATADSAELTSVERVLEMQGRSIRWLAIKTGTEVSTAWRMIKGERRLTAEFRAAAAEVLGVPQDILFPVEPERAAS